MTGSALYQRQIVERLENGKQHSRIMHEVWSPTPWMIDAWTGSSTVGRNQDMAAWCHDKYGPESSPIHKLSGTWRRGNATVYGWTWFGFATEGQMREFESAWPAPEGKP